MINRIFWPVENSNEHKFRNITIKFYTINNHSYSYYHQYDAKLVLNCILIDLESFDFNKYDLRINNSRIYNINEVTIDIIKNETHIECNWDYISDYIKCYIKYDTIEDLNKELDRQGI